MLDTIKETIVKLVTTQGYSIEDNGFYRDKFPLLMIRLSNQSELHTRDLNIQTIDFIIDIFSTYSGEKEIQDIKNNITPTILDSCNKLPGVMGSALRVFKILDDKSTGPVREHGVLNFRFVIEYPLKEE